MPIELIYIYIYLWWLGLAATHRPIVAKERHNYDVFIYHEDDIIFKYSHLLAYLNETFQLHLIAPHVGLYNNVIGFQRYRKIYASNGHSKMKEHDIFEQELFEEMPSFNPICISNHPYLKVGGNTHQAMWIFTSSQINMLQKKCNFLNHSSDSR